MIRCAIQPDGVVRPSADVGQDARWPTAGHSDLNSSTVTDTEWLNTDEAAKRLGITTRTLYRFMDQGRLPSYRFGRVFRLKVGDVAEFIESCKVEPGTLRHLYPDAATTDAEDSEPDGADDAINAGESSEPEPSSGS